MICNPELVAVFVKQFKETSGGFNLRYKQGSFYRCIPMYMDERWKYDHKYFQKMIEQDIRLNPKVVGCIITGMSELNKDKSSIMI